MTAVAVIFQMKALRIAALILAIAAVVMSPLSKADDQALLACTIASTKDGLASPGIAGVLHPLDRVSATALDEFNHSHVLVDLRSGNTSQRFPVNGALSLDWAGLRNLMQSSDRPLLLFGSGKDDSRLAKRLARLNDHQQLRLVEGGAAAILLNQNQPVSDHMLEQLLSVEPVDALSAAMNTDLQVFAIRASLPPLFPASSTVIPINQPDDASTLEHLTRLLGSDDRNSEMTALLIDSSGRQARSLAVHLSRSSKRPVFYLQQGVSGLDEHMRRFANINRQPKLPSVACN